MYGIVHRPEKDVDIVKAVLFMRVCMARDVMTRRSQTTADVVRGCSVIGFFLCFFVESNREGRLTDTLDGPAARERDDSRSCLRHERISVAAAWLLRPTTPSTRVGHRVRRPTKPEASHQD